MQTSLLHLGKICSGCWVIRLASWTLFADLPGFGKTWFNKGTEVVGTLWIVERQRYSGMKTIRPWKVRDKGHKAVWYPIECIEHIYISETLSSIRWQRLWEHSTLWRDRDTVEWELWGHGESGTKAPRWCGILSNTSNTWVVVKHLVRYSDRGCVRTLHCAGGGIPWIWSH